MVHYHQKYTAQDTAEQQSSSLALAKVIAQGVLEHFGLNTFEEYEKLLSDPNQDMFSRGEELPDSIYDFLASHRALSKK